jgi:23S rRNA pseudouridine955/2504/2580 synthase
MRQAHRFERMINDTGSRDFVAGPDDSGRRLDKVLRSLLAELSLSEIYAALRKGKIRVNGAKARPDFRIAEGDKLFIHPSLDIGLRKPFAHKGEDEFSDLESILILATKDILFINKPLGELSQDADSGVSLLSTRVRAALAGRSAASLSFSPGPLHRLDRNTSGVLAFSRSAAGARAFTSLVRERRIEKHYLALVDGEVRDAMEWHDRILRDEGTRKSRVDSSGDEAWASMRPLVAASGHSLLLVELHTGLTHQIRVQASSRGLPLSGDLKYGISPDRDAHRAGGYILHALSLGFPEPPFPDVPRNVVAPLPEASHTRLVGFFGETGLACALEEALCASP